MPLHELESWMWAEACAMLNRADRLHQQLFRPTSLPCGSSSWEPPVDVYETPSESKIMIALPGVAPEHLQVIVESGHLIISGKRHLPVSAETEIRRLEIPYGRFERRIVLPVGRFEMGDQVYANGCLLITLRKI